MPVNDKYVEYVFICTELGEIPLPKTDHQWTAHKGRLMQRKIRINQSSTYVEQSAADDYIDYLNDRY